MPHPLAGASLIALNTTLSLSITRYIRLLKISFRSQEDPENFLLELFVAKEDFESLMCT